MALTAADFEGFDLADARQFLRGCDSRTRKKGEGYYLRGAVKSLICDEPGVSYMAAVQGTREYTVHIFYDNVWDASCTCPLGCDCKHAYAAFKQLLAEQSAAAGAGGLAAAKNGASKPPVEGFAKIVR